MPLDGIAHTTSSIYWLCRLRFFKSRFEQLIEGHPYSWPTIGYVDDLDRVTVDVLKDFFRRWYGPNNAYLVVAVDVKTEDVLELSKNTLVQFQEVKK